MFQISKDEYGNGKGMIIAFPNGYEVSIQFGIGNYCDNRFADNQFHIKVALAKQQYLNQMVNFLNTRAMMFKAGNFQKRWPKHWIM